MNSFNKNIFINFTIIFGLLLIPSFLAAWAEDDGNLPESSYWIYFVKLFYIFRFPTHTLFWSVFSNNGAIVFLSGLLINCCFYAITTERLISIFRTQKK